MLKNKLFKMIFVGCFGISTLIFNALAVEPSCSNDISNTNVFQEYVNNELQKLDFSPLPKTQYEAVVDASKYAYIDLNSVDSTELKNKIVEARNTIIFSQSWVNDEINGYTLDEYGNREEVPKFHEIFPSDWEIPIWKQENQENDSIGLTKTSKESANWDIFFQDYVKLKIPSSIVTSPEFCSISTSGFVGKPNEYHVKELLTVGTYETGGTYNLGYANKETGESLGVKVGLNSGKPFAITPQKNIKVSIRASSYDSPGNWYLTVSTNREFV